MKMEKTEKPPLVWRDHRQITFYIIILTVIALVYLFFFTSAAVLPDPERFKESEYDKAYMFANKRTVTILSAKYSESQSLMELELVFDNKNFDGVDEYKYGIFLKRGNEKKASLDIILDEPTLTVLHLNGIKSGFKEFTLNFVPDYQDVTLREMGQLKLLEKNIEQVDNIDEKTKNEYLRERIYYAIDKYEQEITSLQQSIADMEKRVVNINDKNLQLEENKRYMTVKEIETANNEISSNESEVRSLKQQIKTANDTVSIYMNQIKEAKQTANDIQ